MVYDGTPGNGGGTRGTPVTAVEVGARLEEAFRVLRRLPRDREWRWLEGTGSAMPEPVRSYWERYGHEAARARPPAPTLSEIDRMDEALAWFWWIEDRTVRTVVMARCAGAPWKLIAKTVGYSRSWCADWHGRALERIAERLTF